MKYFLMLSTAAMLLSLTGCFSSSAPVLLGQMPEGYDMYITINPESMDLEEILVSLEENLPEDVIEEIEDADLDIDLFDWQECKETLNLRDGDIGLISNTEDDEIVAVFLPCDDSAALEEFIEDNDFGETEFLTSGDYTVMIITWDDDDLVEDLEDDLAGDLLSEDPVFLSMDEAVGLEDACVSFFFSEEVAEVPIYGAFSTNSSESLLKVCVITDNDEVALYMDVLGDGLVSENIKFPENTMAAFRYNLDMNWLAEEFEEIEERTGEDYFEEVEDGLPFIGFSSIEEFIAVFQGDFCLSVQEIELDSYSELDGGAGVFAISLLESETLISSLSMISMVPESSIEEYDDFTAYRIRESGENIWVFIDKDVLYVTFNTDPEEVIDGISAGEYFNGGIAADGFMGGSVDPEALLDGINAEDDIREIITTIFSDRADFSVTSDEQMFTATAVAGPDVLKSFVSLIGVIVSQSFNTMADSSLEYI